MTWVRALGYLLAATLAAGWTLIGLTAGGVL
jgi:hypothetical protein